MELVIAVNYTRETWTRMIRLKALIAKKTICVLTICAYMYTRPTTGDTICNELKMNILFLATGKVDFTLIWLLIYYYL